MLDAMARPGEVADLPARDGEAEDASASGLFPATVQVLDVLLDAATDVAVAGSHGAAAERVLADRCHVAQAPAERARYAVLPVAVRNDEAAAFVGGLFEGTLLDPDLGATCIVECSSLLGSDRTGARGGSVAQAHPLSFWKLTGPGVKGSSTLGCDRADAVRARIARADEFPLGIDLFLVDSCGHVAAIPRSSAVSESDEEEGGTSWAM